MKRLVMWSGRRRPTAWTPAHEVETPVMFGRSVTRCGITLPARPFNRVIGDDPDCYDCCPKCYPNRGPGP